MFKTKLAALPMIPLAFFCSVALAQKPSAGIVKSTTPTELKPQTPSASIAKPTTPKSQTRSASIAKSTTPTRPKPPTPATAPQPDTEPRQGISAPKEGTIVSAAPVQSALTDVLPAACAPPVYAVPPKDVYGAYVPFVPPPKPAACITVNAQPASSSPPNSSGVQKTQSASLNLVQPAGNSLASLTLDPTSSSDGSPAGEGYVRSVPAPPPATIPQEVTPFRSIAIGFKADTLGLGVEFATPMAYRLNLRTSVNFFAFNAPFNIDGVDYDARLHLKSSQTTVDWFPRGEGGFHISPGILYLKNTLSAPASVGPGQTFVLGTQTYVNSVDDPVSGSSSVVYPHTFAPLLLLGYGNIIPRTRQRLSFPIEVGVAFTGAPQMSVALNGTACTTNGCVNFTNPDPQKSLKQEINILNDDLKSYPVFPILSVGFAYHF